MPHMRAFRGTYVPCTEGIRGAFLVTDETINDWNALVQHVGHGQPTNVHGYRLRPYPAFDVDSHAPYAPSGVYVDYRDPAVEQAAYNLRNRLLREQFGERQAVLRHIALILGFRHWRDVYNTVRNVGRRETGENGRNHQGELVWRRWNSTYSRQATAIADAHSEYRHFGIEIEYNNRATNNTAIGVDSRADGVTFTDRWGNYGRSASHAGWQGTYDSTVSGGEIISDILVGDDASHDEVRDMLRRIRNHGGEAGPGQGMHVHHDVRDFSVEDRVRLVDNLQASQDAVLAYVGHRRTSQWARPLDSAQWATARTAVANGRPVSIGRYVAFNMARMHDRGAIEFRSLGNTLNGRKVRAWVRLGQAIMQATKDGVTFRPGITTPELCTVLRGHGLTAWAERVILNRTGHGVTATV